MTAVIKNKTTLFLLPCLNLSLSDLGPNFINCYIAHLENDKYNDPMLFLSFSKCPTNDKVFRTCVEQYDIDNVYILVHKLPSEYINDYVNFLHGKYSKISDDLKDKIKTMYGAAHYSYKVVTKHPDRRKWLEDYIDEKLHDEAELMSIIKEEEETYKTNLMLC